MNHQVVKGKEYKKKMKKQTARGKAYLQVPITKTSTTGN